jgi:2'-hydroxyisoflavone reductase
MRLLILGGTWFLGRTLAELALARGWELTTFSRGLHGRDAAGTVPVRGRREDPGDMVRLAGAGPWDAVVDTSGYTPDVVELAARALRDRVGRYVLVSSVNVYRGWPAVPLTDDSLVYQDTGEAAEPLPLAAKVPALDVGYGQRKAACERVVQQAFGPAGSLALRPGVILGPHEYVGRLPWLLRRMERGGRVLAAGPPTRAVQPVDVRDLATFTMRAVEKGLAGAMNVTAPPGHATYGDLLEGCRDAAGARAEIVAYDTRGVECVL